MLLLCTVPLRSYSQGWPEKPHVDTLRAYIGHTETESNSSPHVDRFLASVGLDPGYPWCAAFVSYGLDKADADYPPVRSALSRDFVTSRSVKARRVITRNLTIPPGWIITWRRGNTIYGHTEVATQWKGKSGISIGGNTTPPGGEGADWNGGGVYEKERNINPGSYFRITDFTPVDYENDYRKLSDVRGIRVRYRILDWGRR